jgi:SOS-response transcriptional repressor LexA
MSVSKEEVTTGDLVVVDKEQTLNQLVVAKAHEKSVALVIVTSEARPKT